MPRNAPPLLLALVLVFVSLGAMPLAPVANAAGFIDFEDGVDARPIRSSIPGLQFTTTAGYDWVYGDWRSGTYNGRYPNGTYTSNGERFAWLGPNQGAGRIDFTGEQGASYLSVWVSTGEPVIMTGYDSSGRPIAQSPLLGPNIGTGRMDELRVQAATRSMRYAIIQGRANKWLIDDLATDADGVPDTRTPLIFLPGIMGSELINDEGEVWVDAWRVARDPGDNYLRVLRLLADGETPWDTDDVAYTSLRVGDIIRHDGKDAVYEPLVTYLTQERGYRECEQAGAVCADGTLFVFPYDWRKDLGATAERLEGYIQEVMTATGAKQVNLLAHSMGGLVARRYIADPARAANVSTLVTMGTPYLGAPKAYQALHYRGCLATAWVGCWLNRTVTTELVQNFPGNYALIPSAGYFQAYPHGHVRREFDSDGDGAVDGWLSAAAIDRIQRLQHNTYLTNQAAQFHAGIQGFASGTNGVAVYAFVGYGFGDTPGAVREYLRGEGRQTELRHDVLVMNGDDTVPLHSANLGRGGAGTDLSGGISFFYVRARHGDLPKSRAVQRLAADLLSVRTSAGAQTELAAQVAPVRSEAPDADGLLRVEAAPAQAEPPVWDAIDAAPRPLAGRQLVIGGEVTVEVRDAAGRILRVTPQGEIETDIPGVGGYRLEEATAVFLPSEGSFELRVLAGEAGSVDLRMRVVQGGEVNRMTAYHRVAFQDGTRGALRFVPGQAPGAMALDDDGDGATDREAPPLATLGQEASLDWTAPTSSASVECNRASQGWCVGSAQVTLQAVDEGGSGLARLEYSLDGGQTFAVYAEAFTVESSVATVLVRAVDKAGNEQFPLTIARVGPERVTLPLLRR